jgi:predicted CXXCH cytochrome family protein
MQVRRALRIVCVVLPLAAWMGAFGLQAGKPESSKVGKPESQEVGKPGSQEGFVGAAKCGECHEGIHRKWAGGRHSKMLQPATPETVLGDFSRSAVTLRGTKFNLERSGDRYVIRGPFPTAREATLRIDYTLGSRRVQHYLTTLADGRIVVLPPTWDVAKREWFHNLDIVNPDEATRNPVQVWNSNCFGCHVSAEVKGFDPARLRYDTTWTDFGTNCERCHGPGAAHVARYAPVSPTAGPAAIIVPTRLTAERSTMVCAQCHSLRDVTVPGFTAGADYFDHFMPVLEYGQKSDRDPAYWVDGRPRRFSNDAIGFWQSGCFVKGGATCMSCHADPHEPDIDRTPALARANNDLCTRCHEAIGRDLPAHTRHASGSEGSSCIACHMPATVVSLRTRMPDHTISVPAPENTVRYDIPNACTECHQDRDAAWAVKALERWYPNGRRQRLVERAAAFSAARRRDPNAVESLLALAADSRQPPIARANAVGYLRFFPAPNVRAALVAAAASDQPIIRATAVLGLGEPRFAADSVAPALIAALSDTTRIVRIGAMLSLVNLRVTTMPPEVTPRFDQARRDYLTRATLLADDPGVLLDAGKFHLMNQDANEAARSLEASLRLDGNLHAARYFLAVCRLAQGRVPDARDLLNAIPKSSPYGEQAAKLLAALPGK